MKKVLQERSDTASGAPTGHCQYRPGHDQPANAADQMNDRRHHHPGNNTEQ